MQAVPARRAGDEHEAGILRVRRMRAGVEVQVFTHGGGARPCDVERQLAIEHGKKDGAGRAQVGRRHHERNIAERHDVTGTLGGLAQASEDGLAGDEGVEAGFPKGGNADHHAPSVGGACCRSMTIQ
jgi:hypothetical protein